MARAKRKPPAKPAAFISPHHRGHFCPVIRYPNTKPPPPTIHTPQKPHGPIKRHQPTPEHKKPAAAPNTAGRFHFFAPPRSLLLPSSDTRTQSPRRRRQYTPHKNLTARSNGTDRRPNTKKPAAASNAAGRFHFSAAPPSLLPPSSDTRTQKTRCRSEHRRPLSFLRTTAVTSAPSSDTRTQSPRRRQYTPHKNLTARSNGTDRYPNTKKPAAAPNTAGRFRFL